MSHNPSIEGIFERHTSKHVGVSLGLLTAGTRRMFNYGVLRKDGPPVTEDVIFEVGSITKVFTALLLADMTFTGDVQLDDPVQQYLPNYVRLAQRGRPITLGDLSSHTSGLPRLPPGLLRRSLIGQQRHNPYANFMTDDLYHAVNATQLRRRPGVIRYSNFTVGLLGFVLAQRAGMSYEQLVHERVCVPLGLRDTSTIVPTSKLMRFADGHNRRGRVTMHWDFDALAGAGALRSTVSDMLVFIELQLRESAGRLNESARLTHKTRAGRSGKRKIGLGWHEYQLRRANSQTALWHSGGTGGFSSFCGFVPETKTGVVVLSNSTRLVDKIGLLSLEALNTT